MAALALLFAVHSYQPSPFFVLDEVDAALDNANVGKIARYIGEHAGPGMQFVVISLKTGLFQNSEALVGIYRDQGGNSSKALTLDVSYLFFCFVEGWESRACGSRDCGWSTANVGCVPYSYANISRHDFRCDGRPPMAYMVLRIETGRT